MALTTSSLLRPATSTLKKCNLSSLTSRIDNVIQRETLTKTSSTLINHPKNKPTTRPHTTPPPRIALPGKGLFFFHQMGLLSYLTQSYPLTFQPSSSSPPSSSSSQTTHHPPAVQMAGASAGAVVAALTAVGANGDEAVDMALALARERGLWDRKGGLAGVWGGLIENRWLSELIPEDVSFVNDGRLTILLTPIPRFGKVRISEFQSKDDLIQCVMASIHLPWFLDGKATRVFRGETFVDGSFLVVVPDDFFPSPPDNKDVINLHWKRDPWLTEGGAGRFVSLTREEDIRALVQRGREFGRILEGQGVFESLR